MCDDEQRRVTLLGELDEQGQTLFRPWTIQTGGRFIGDDESRMAGEGPRDGDALLLANGELTWAMAEPVLETDPDPGALRAATSVGWSPRGRNVMPSSTFSRAVRLPRRLKV